jgi:hypothetical protein
LPVASSIAIGDEFIIKNIAGATGNSLVVQSAGTDLIDGSSTYSLPLAFDCVWIKYTNTNRFSIISKIVNV